MALIQGWAIGGIPKYPPRAENLEKSPLSRKTLDPPSPERGKKAKGPPLSFSVPPKGTGLNFTELTGFKLDLAVINVKIT